MGTLMKTEEKEGETMDMRYLTVAQVMERLNLSRSSVNRLRKHHGLTFIRLGEKPRCKEQDLIQWLRNRPEAIIHGKVI